MPDLAPLKLDVIANTAPFVREIGKARRQAMTFAGTMEKRVSGSLATLGRTLKSTTGLLTIFTGAAGVGGLIAQSIKLAATAEQTEVAFATMLGTAAKAKKLIKELDAFSAATPFEPEEVKAAARQLLAFGVRQEDIISRFRTLGDAAAGSNSRIGELVPIFGKIKSAGIASLGDLQQFGDRSINVIGQLAKQLGTTEFAVRKMVSAGKIGFPEVLKALEAMTTEGGLFADAMARQSETLGGLFSTIKGEFTRVLTDFGTAITESGKFKKNMEDVIELMRGADLTPFVRSIEGVAGFVADVLVGMQRVEALILQQAARQESRIFAQAMRRGDATGAAESRERFLSIRRRQARLLAGIEAAERDKHRVSFFEREKRRIALLAKEEARIKRKEQQALGLIPGGPGIELGVGGGPVVAAGGGGGGRGPSKFGGFLAGLSKTLKSLALTAEGEAGRRRRASLGPSSGIMRFGDGGALLPPLNEPSAPTRLSGAATFGSGGALSALNRARTGGQTDSQKIVEELRKLVKETMAVRVALAKAPPTRIQAAGLDRA